MYSFTLIYFMCYHNGRYKMKLNTLLSWECSCERVKNKCVHIFFCEKAPFKEIVWKRDFFRDSH